MVTNALATLSLHHIAVREPVHSADAAELKIKALQKIRAGSQDLERGASPSNALIATLLLLMFDDMATGESDFTKVYKLLKTLMPSWRQGEKGITDPFPEFLQGQWKM